MNQNETEERFKPGMQIICDHMEDDPRPIPDGTKGTIWHVDSIGTIHCIFENGTLLGLIPGVDRFHIVGGECNA